MVFENLRGPGGPIKLAVPRGALLTETLAGTHLVHDVGYLASGMTASYEQMVICNELIHWVKRFVQPVEISDETLALDLIAENGADGQYLNTPHTGAHFRQDWYSRLFDRQNIADWEKAGSTTLRQRAVAQARKLLARHQPEPLPAGALAALDRIIEAGRQRGST